MSGVEMMSGEEGGRITGERMEGGGAGRKVA